MREILFRGKVSYGTWVVGSLICFNGKCGILEEIKCGPPCSNMINRDTYLNMCSGDIDGVLDIVDLETVGQFTGLVDKNGRNIFEGDVVQYQFGTVSTEIKYHVQFIPDRGGWYPFASGDGCGCCESDTIQPSTEGVVDNVIVIGNIHDNPELLEENHDN